MQEVSSGSLFRLGVFVVLLEDRSPSGMHVQAQVTQHRLATTALLVIAHPRNFIPMNDQPALMCQTVSAWPINLREYNAGVGSVYWENSSSALDNNP